MKLLKGVAVGLVVLGVALGWTVLGEEEEITPTPSIAIGVMSFDGLSIRLQPKPWLIFEGDINISGWAEGIGLYPVTKVFVLWQDPFYLGGMVEPVFSLVPIYEEFCNDWGCWREGPKGWQWEVSDFFIGILGMGQWEIASNTFISAEFSFQYSLNQSAWFTMTQLGIHTWFQLK